jgi:mRNA deadenylase 3'-5' endonuclease subunit Ccr4
MAWSPSQSNEECAHEFDKDGSEPNFTNYAKVKDDEPFSSMLDYIFLSPSWKVKGMKTTTPR